MRKPNKTAVLVEVLDAYPSRAFTAAVLSRLTKIDVSDVGALLAYRVTMGTVLRKADMKGRTVWQSSLSGLGVDDGDDAGPVVRQIVVPATEAKPLRPRGPRCVFELGAA